jgi:hypothetical protein
MTESLLVFRRNRGDLDVFDQKGNRLGSSRAARSARRSRWIQFDSGRDHELVDAADACLLHLQDTGSHWKGRAIKWVYELKAPHSPEATKLQRIDRSTGTASITQGEREIGWLRPLRGSDGFVIADRDDKEVGRGLVANERLLRGPDLLVRVNSSAPEELRRVTLAAAVIADRELPRRSGGGGGAA